MRLNNRVERLEARAPMESLGRPFLWCQGQSLAEALAHAKLTLADKPLFAIRLVGMGQDDCPLFLRNEHLLAAE